MWFLNISQYIVNVLDTLNIAYIHQHSEEFVYIINTGFILFTVALCTLLLRYLERRLFGVYTDCWFCKSNQTVPYDKWNNFKCLYCEQPNGFNEDGDYIQEIPAQRKREMNGDSLAVRSNNELAAPSVLCLSCVDQQATKQRLRNQFEPIREANFDAELKTYEQKLERRFPLCASCERRRCHIIRRDNIRYQPLLQRLMNERLSRQDSTRVKCGDISYIMASWLPCALILVGLVEFTFRSFYGRSLTTEFGIQVDPKLLGPKEFILASLIVQLVNLVFLIRNRYLEVCVNLILSLVLIGLFLLQSKLELDSRLSMLQLGAGWTSFLLFTYLNYRQLKLESKSTELRIHTPWTVGSNPIMPSPVDYASRRSTYSDSGHPATPTPSLSRTPSCNDMPDVLENTMSDLNIREPSLYRYRGPSQPLQVGLHRANSEIIRPSRFQGSLPPPSVSQGRALSVRSLAQPQPAFGHSSNDYYNHGSQRFLTSPTISRPGGFSSRSLTGLDPVGLSHRGASVHSMPCGLNNTNVNSEYNQPLSSTYSSTQLANFVYENGHPAQGIPNPSRCSEESPRSEYRESDSYTHEWLLNNGPHSPSPSDSSVLFNGSVASYRTAADPVILNGCTWLSAVILGASLAFNLTFVLYHYAQNLPAV